MSVAVQEVKAAVSGCPLVVVRHGRVYTLIPLLHNGRRIAFLPTTGIGWNTVDRRAYVHFAGAVVIACFPLWISPLRRCLRLHRPPLRHPPRWGMGRRRKTTRRMRHLRFRLVSFPKTGGSAVGKSGIPFLGSPLCRPRPLLPPASPRASRPCPPSTHTTRDDDLWTTTKRTKTARPHHVEGLGKKAVDIMGAPIITHSPRCSPCIAKARETTQSPRKNLRTAQGGTRVPSRKAPSHNDWERKSGKRSRSVYTKPSLAPPQRRRRLCLLFQRPPVCIVVRHPPFALRYRLHARPLPPTG